MTRECQARFSERRRVRFPPPTRHTLIHHSEWEVRIRDRLPEFLPPTYLDPQRRPRRNLLHGVGTLLRKIA